jgi:hypothetical protein
MSVRCKYLKLIFAVLLGLTSPSYAATEAGIGCLDCSSDAFNPLNENTTEFASSIANSVPDNRIQVGKWVDPVNNIEDPLNEIVEIRYLKNDKFAGTGTFLKDCRIITALHVLLSMSHGERTMRLQNDDESLIGEKFDFFTNAVPTPDGKIQKVLGSFVVLGHGKPLRHSFAANAEDDWVVGYDPNCLSNKYNLGYVIPINGQRLDSMETREYITAGHSQLAAAKNEKDEYSLYIDSKCNVSNREYVNDSYILTNCSFWDGGSGQLLMTPAKKKGKILIGPGGHPVKLAHAIFQAVNPTVDLNVPNIKGASGVAPFTYDLWNKMLPHLEGAVDTQKLASIAAARHQTATAVGLSARRQQ